MRPEIKHQVCPYLSRCPFPFSSFWPRPLQGRLSILSASIKSDSFRLLVHPPPLNHSVSRPSAYLNPIGVLLNSYIHRNNHIAWSKDVQPLFSTRTPVAASRELQTKPSMALDGEQVSEDGAPREVSAFKYYFLLIAGLVILIALLLWYLHRRTTRRRQFWDYNGEQALAGDGQGGYNPRGFVYGVYGASNSFLGRRSDGEAPPSYYSKSGAPTIDVVIPLPTLSRNSSLRSWRSQRSRSSRLPQYLDDTDNRRHTARQQDAVRRGTRLWPAV